MQRLLVIFVAIFLMACDSNPQSTDPPGAININQATVEQLEKLPGIGPVKARSIIASRNARGGMFTTLEELEKIDGIGPLTLDRIRPFVHLGPPKPKK